LYTTNPTWIGPGANPGLRGERLATNDLSNGTALEVPLTPEDILLFRKAAARRGALNKSKKGTTAILTDTWLIETL
jgi:hypothetical protein